MPDWQSPDWLKPPNCIRSDACAQSRFEQRHGLHPPTWFQQSVRGYLSGSELRQQLTKSRPRMARRYRSGEAELLFLLRPGERQRAGEIGDGEVGWSKAIGDGVDDSMRDEGERQEEADVALD